MRLAKLRDRRPNEATGTDDERIPFTSSILPELARRTKNLDSLLPVLYLRGVSTGEFRKALAASARTVNLSRANSAATRSRVNPRK
jgi:hypothetical protein